MIKWNQFFLNIQNLILPLEKHKQIKFHVFRSIMCFDRNVCQIIIRLFRGNIIIIHSLNHNYSRNCCSNRYSPECFEPSNAVFAIVIIRNQILLISPLKWRVSNLCISDAYTWQNSHSLMFHNNLQFWMVSVQYFGWNMIK